MILNIQIQIQPLSPPVFPLNQWNSDPFCNITAYGRSRSAVQFNPCTERHIGIWEWWTMLLLTLPQADTEEERSALSKAKLLLNGGSKVQLLWSGNEDWQRQQTRQGHGWGHTRTPPSSSYPLLASITVLYCTVSSLNAVKFTIK